MLDRVVLTNFKAFRRQQIPLSGLTLLTGLNSSGKSTVMQALALLRQSATARMLTTNSGLLLNGDLVELGAGRDVLHTDWTADPEIEGEYLRIEVGIDGKLYCWTADYSPSADVLPLTAAPSLRQSEPDGCGRALLAQGSRNFQYLRADRVSPAATYRRSYETAIEQGFLGAHGEHAVNYLRHFQEEQVTAAELRHPRAQSANLLRQTEAWLGELSPGVNLQAVGIDGTDLVRLSYGFGGTAGLAASNPQRPTNVGFGLTYTLPIVLACLTAGPGSLLLLENPEAHLHPRGQTRLASLMAKATAAGAQLVVETHSDHVLNGLRLAVKNGILAAKDVGLHYFQRQESGGVEITNPKIGPDGMLSAWPEGFFDEWDNSVMELLD